MVFAKTRVCAETRVCAKTMVCAKTKVVPGSTKHATTDGMAATVHLQTYHCVAVIVLLCYNVAAMA